MKANDKKPKPEEILEKHTKESQWYAPVCDARILKAMQEFADLYHKEKLREELIAYDEYLDEYVDHKRSELRVDTYLKQKQ